jgi:alkylation response protein AidB-like acyl-CoA dehydrogenase
MRWLGSAVRAQEIATDYARNRMAFGKTLGEHEGVSFMLADNHMDIHQARLSILHTAWLLDRGERAANESSMSKVVCSEAIARVADRSMQILGGMGMTRDTVVELPVQAGVPGEDSGRQRRQGRKPASAAAAADG